MDFEINTGQALSITHGVQEVAKERNKQLVKHGYTAKYQAEHPEYYANGQLQDAAYELLKVDRDGYPAEDIKYAVNVPLNWDSEWFIRLCEKPQKDRIRIAAALLSAELDRLKYILDNNL